MFLRCFFDEFPKISKSENRANGFPQNEVEGDELLDVVASSKEKRDIRQTHRIHRILYIKEFINNHRSLKISRWFKFWQPIPGSRSGRFQGKFATVHLWVIVVWPWAAPCSLAPGLGWAIRRPARRSPTISRLQPPSHLQNFFACEHLEL